MSAKNRSSQLATYTIYRSPADHPYKFVVRRAVIDEGKVVPDSDPLYVGESFEEARAVIPAGLVCFDRDQSDFLAIVETWI